MKGVKVKQLGHVDDVQVDETGKLLKNSPTSPRINFPNPSVNINNNTKEVTMKKVKGAAVTANRLDKTGEKDVSMPSRVVEEWIDIILKQDDNWDLEIEKPTQADEATETDSSETSGDEK